MKRFFFSIVLSVAFAFAGHAQNFALVDMEYILEQIPAYEAAAQEMDDLSAGWQEEVEAISSQAKALYEEYQDKAETLTDAQKADLEQRIIAKEKEAASLRMKYFGQEGELVERRDALFGPIQDSVYSAIKEIALRDGYDVVFDRASAQSMVFASPRIDISNEVLSILGYSN